MKNDEVNFENYLLKSSKFLNIPIIATQEVFYLDQSMYEAHDALTCIGEKISLKTITDLNLAMNII